VEVIRGWCHHAFPVTDASCVGEARRFAAKAIEPWGWPESDAGRLSLVVTELGTNLMRHAVDGALWIAVKDGLQEVEVLALDRGPGIATTSTWPPRPRARSAWRGCACPLPARPGGPPPGWAP
jgi:anti-sigma regulatory factor (Ser/Thr protein kinase)